MWSRKKKDIKKGKAPYRVEVEEQVITLTELVTVVLPASVGEAYGLERHAEFVQGFINAYGGWVDGYEVVRMAEGYLVEFDLELRWQVKRESVRKLRHEPRRLWLRRMERDWEVTDPAHRRDLRAAGGELPRSTRYGKNYSLGRLQATAASQAAELLSELEGCEVVWIEGGVASCRM